MTPAAASGKSPGAAVVSSAITIENSAPSISGLVINGIANGQAYTGATLTASYRFHDLDEDGEGSSTYQWFYDDTPEPTSIGGARFQNYTVIDGDMDKVILVRVTPKDSKNSIGAIYMSAAVKVVNLAPVASNVRIIDAVGSTPDKRILAALYDYADHEGDPSGTPLHTWKRNGVPVASTASYALSLGDAGSVISVEVTAVALRGTPRGVAVAATTGLNVPSVTVALNVSSRLKQLHFSWAAVTGATRYRVSYSPDGASGFVPVSTDSNNLTTTAYDWDISVHRINWPMAQFMLEACDTSNACLQSASTSALNVMLDTIGYFKASNTKAYDYFGASVAMSDDGNTLVVGASGESSAAVGGNPLDDCAAPSPANCAKNSGAVYVYARKVNAWSQQAYVKASNPGGGDYFGTAVALSGDGNTLAVGASSESCAKTGVISGAPNEAATPNAALGKNFGAVYLFTRSGSIWSQQAYVKASNTGAGDYFGRSVTLSGDGNTLAVGANGESSAKILVISGSPDEVAAPNDALGDKSGAVYLFTRSNTTWSQQAYVKASNTGSGDYFGWSVALSTDGNTLAVGAYYEDSATTSIISGAPTEATTLNGASTSGAVYVYIRSSGAWSQQAYVKASNTGVGDFFGQSVALSGDGNTLAVGSFYESGATTGVIPGAPDEVAAPNSVLGYFSGAVYLFTRSDITWSQQAYVKASNTGVSDWFGYSVALSADGNTLAVGAHREGSAKTGVILGVPDETATLNDAPGSGAVYLFTRSGATWLQQAYVKAPNAGADDAFGVSVALSADGTTLGVGASAEDSAATGVNNTAPGQGDNSAPDAGAVYLY